MCILDTLGISAFIFSEKYVKSITYALVTKRITAIFIFAARFIHFRTAIKIEKNVILMIFKYIFFIFLYKKDI